MIVYDFDSIASLLEEDGYLFKMLLNESGVALFPHTIEHRDATQPGIKYADDMTYQARIILLGAV